MHLRNPPCSRPCSPKSGTVPSAAGNPNQETRHCRILLHHKHVLNQYENADGNALQSAFNCARIRASKYAETIARHCLNWPGTAALRMYRVVSSTSFRHGAREPWKKKQIQGEDDSQPGVIAPGIMAQPSQMSHLSISCLCIAPLAKRGLSVEEANGGEHNGVHLSLCTTYWHLCSIALRHRFPPFIGAWTVAQDVIAQRNLAYSLFVSFLSFFVPLFPPNFIVLAHQDMSSNRYPGTYSSNF